jgi:hypothetical protein
MLQHASGPRARQAYFLKFIAGCITETERVEYLTFIMLFDVLVCETLFSGQSCIKNYFALYMLCLQGKQNIKFVNPQKINFSIFYPLNFCHNSRCELLILLNLTSVG